ncbi:uncharacterized protein LOC143911314 [Arctopsyche grandis]|uniref:uncharacterized protein LOC143911314 n=1 Tax=Arctopsyche grandis TaxID=121162 RepID=UPI00406D9A18
MTATKLEFSIFGYLVPQKVSVQWNHILSGMMFFVLFFVIFPVTHSYTIGKNHGMPSISTECHTSHFDVYYIVKCNDVDVNSLTAIIEEEVEKFPNGKRIIDHLIIENLSTGNRKLTQDWINTTSFQILELSIHSAEIDSIENNAFKGFAFEELIYLQLEDTKIDSLEEGTFEGIQLLKYLVIHRCEINRINEYALKVVAPNLERLIVMEMVLPLNVANLTGTVSFPNLWDVVIIKNKMASLDAGSFSRLENVEFVHLYSNQIENISCGNFQMTSLKKLYLEHNLIASLDPCVFGDDVISGLDENAITLRDNKWNCNCDLNWLKQLKIENIIWDSPTCTSHANLHFEEVNFCDEELSTTDTNPTITD